MIKNLLRCLALLLCASPLFAQTGTPHGVSVTWTAPTAGSDTNAIAGYNIYQCAGTCTAASVWTKIDTALDISTGYLVPLASLTPGATYSYASTAVDTAGNESAFSNIATVSLPATLPTNPAAPTNTTAKVQ